jgi:hypothetical protein
MPDDPTAKVARAYADFFEGLTPEQVPDLSRLAAPDVHFRDPLTEGHGIDALERAVRAIFTAMDDPQVKIGTIATAGRTIFIVWTVTFRRKGRRNEWTIQGVAELEVGAQDRIVRHFNYWDAAGQLYEHVPVLGSLMRTIRRQVVAEAHRES